MVRFLADENVPRSVTNWLKENGHNVTRVQDVGLSGASDVAVAKRAMENGMIVITLDEDFVGLRQMGTRLGTIVIKTHPATPERVKDLLSTLLSKVQVEKHDKDLLLVTDKEIRIESR